MREACARRGVILSDDVIAELLAHLDDVYDDAMRQTGGSEREALAAVRQAIDHASYDDLALTQRARAADSRLLVRTSPPGREPRPEPTVGRGWTWISHGPVIYIPYAQKPFDFLNWMGLVIRTGGEPLPATSIKAAIASVDPSQPVEAIQSMEDYVRRETAPYRFGSLVTGSLAATAFLLALAGVHAIAAFVVGRRARELAVRLALGATRTSIMRHAVSRLGGIVLIGAIGGAAGSVITRRLLLATFPESTSIGGTTSWTPLMACVLIATVATLVALLPPVRLVRALRRHGLRFIIAVVVVLCGVGVSVDAQTPARSTPKRVENVVQGVRRWWTNHPPEWRRKTASCLHYLDEAETHHNTGQEDFVAASRAKSNEEEKRLVRLGNDEIAERTRLIREFWACTRRTASGDEFASQEPPSKTPIDPPPDDPGGPPPTPVPPESPPETPPETPPDTPWGLPPGFPFPPAEARPTPRPRPGSSAPLIVALGDSITAGYGLKPTETYPALLQQRLQRDGYRHRVVNAGVNGDTTADARRRLAAALRPGTSIVIVALGLNDVKTRPPRPIAEIQRDLEAIIAEAQRRRLTVLLCGFKMPLAIDTTYERQFREIYPALAAKYHVPLIPDLMSIVWQGDNMTSDGFHPNATGARFIARQVYSALKPLLGPAAAVNSR